MSDVISTYETAITTANAAFNASAGTDDAILALKDNVFDAITNTMEEINDADLRSLLAVQASQVHLHPCLGTGWQPGLMETISSAQAACVQVIAYVVETVSSEMKIAA